MPMYEFCCRDCGHAFEKLVKSMTTTEAVACPECRSTETGRELSVFAVGAEGAKASAAAPAGGCGRCGGPGPCGFQ